MLTVFSSPHAKREGEVAGRGAKRRDLTVGASAGGSILSKANLP